MIDAKPPFLRRFIFLIFGLWAVMSIIFAYWWLFLLFALAIWGIRRFFKMLDKRNAYGS
jgi:fatty acid desaturase